MSEKKKSAINKLIPHKHTVTVELIFIFYLSFVTNIVDSSVILCLKELQKVFCTLYYQA